MVTQLELDVEQNCIEGGTCKGSECVHCHLISSFDVLRAITKLKTDKVNGVFEQLYTWHRPDVSILKDDRLDSKKKLFLHFV